MNKVLAIDYPTGSLEVGIPLTPEQLTNVIARAMRDLASSSGHLPTLVRRQVQSSAALGYADAANVVYCSSRTRLGVPGEPTLEVQRGRQEH